MEVSLPSNCSGTIPISSAAVFCFMNILGWMIGNIIGVLKNEPPCYMDGHCWSWSWNKIIARIIIYAVVLVKASIDPGLFVDTQIYNVVRHPQSGTVGLSVSSSKFTCAERGGGYGGGPTLTAFLEKHLRCLVGPKITWVYGRLPVAIGWLQRLSMVSGPWILMARQRSRHRVANWRCSQEMPQEIWL